MKVLGGNRNLYLDGLCKHQRHVKEVSKIQRNSIVNIETLDSKSKWT